jgi:endonuclease YncB( thermonuclease family)
MAREIRGIRKVTDNDDGDTIYLEKFALFRNGKKFSSFQFRKKSLTSKGFLKIRLLGIDTPELHYGGPQKCPVGAKRLKGKDRPKIPPQQPWAANAKTGLIKMLADGARVIVELDREIFDQYDRILGYVWSASKDWEMQELLNARLVERGLAFPYQIWPNLAQFRPIKEAAKMALGASTGVFAAVAPKILTLAQTRENKYVNEPFLYRKAVDGAICQVDPKTLLTRWVGDASSWNYFKPTSYRSVPIPYRVFFNSEEEAIRAGFIQA